MGATTFNYSYGFLECFRGKCAHHESVFEHMLSGGVTHLDLAITQPVSGKHLRLSKKQNLLTETVNREPNTVVDLQIEEVKCENFR